MDKGGTTYKDQAGITYPPLQTTALQGAGAPTVSTDPTGKQTILTFPDAAIASKTADAVSPPIAMGTALMQKNGKVTLAQTSALALGLYIAGIAVTSGTAGSSIQIITQGPVDPSIVNVGAGVACAVGLNASGVPVRVTDATCVSSTKYLGSCDVNGAIFVSQRYDTKFRTSDFGCTGLGVVDDTAGLQAAVSLASANTLAKKGSSVVHVEGALLCTSEIVVDGAVTFTSDGVVPGGINANVNTYATLIHDFDGDFIHFTGANGVSDTSGGGVERLRIVQKFGGAADGIPRGRAIKVTGVDSDHLPNWINLRQLVIEEAGNSPWTLAIDIDGSSCGGISNVRMLEVSTHTGAGATGGIRLFAVFSAKLIATECHNTNGHYIFDGPSGIHTVGVQLIGGDGQTIMCDHADQIAVIGGSYEAITTTANTGGPNTFAPSQLVTPFADTSGTAASGAIFYDPSSLGPGYWRMSKPLAMQNSQFAAAIKADGSAAISLLGLDTDNTVRLIPSADAILAIGAPGATNGGGSANGDVILGKSNKILIVNHANDTPMRALQMSDDTLNILYVGLGTGASALMGGGGIKIWADATGISFYGASTIAKQTVSGVKLPSDTVMGTLLTVLANLGLITDSTT